LEGALIILRAVGACKQVTYLSGNRYSALDYLVQYELFKNHLSLFIKIAKGDYGTSAAYFATAVFEENKETHGKSMHKK